LREFKREFDFQGNLEKCKCDENGLPEKNWKNEIATKKKLAGS
jgi:hypothetical protein